MTEMMGIESMRKLVERRGGHWEIQRILYGSSLETVQIYIPKYLEKETNTKP